MSILDRNIVLNEHTNQVIGIVGKWVKSIKKGSSVLPYAYPCENYIGTILSNKIVCTALQQVVDKYCKEQIESIKLKSISVTEKGFPRLWEIMHECCHILKVKSIPQLYITNQLKGINALTVGTDDNHLILLSPKSVVALSNVELKFMLGHELGHILQRNLMCHTIKGILDKLNDKSTILGPMVADLIDVPLNQWYRCAEYTADRAGLLCCNDINVATNLLCSFIEPIQDNILLQYYELDNAHPYIQNRVKELKRFGKVM